MLWPASAHAAALDGSRLSLLWAIPFAGILLSIAMGPLLFPKIWHDHYGKIAALWAALTLLPIGVQAGPIIALESFLHAMLLEYMSFIILLFALYVVAGGILVTGDLKGTPRNNTLMLGLGATMASFVGTTGASMILIRPMLQANEGRSHKVHVFVFFIFLVSNIGGALTPLGDPPLFVGFLRGVEFFWTARHLWAETLFVGGIVLAAFFMLDWFFYRRESKIVVEPESTSPLQIQGWINFVLIGGIIGAILMSAAWNPGITFTVPGATLQLQNLVRDGLLLMIALTSLVLTPNEHREANGFTWEPIAEVAKLFAGIFVCIIPVLAMLQAGPKGSLAFLLRAVTDRDGTPNEMAYFWLTGSLSAILDNAPTYLVFFELAPGDVKQLMGPLAPTLAAISMGAVYMGAMTYIGNAPNFMVYAIARERGVPMPSFFGYVLWSVIFLLPVFALMSWLFIRAA